MDRQMKKQADKQTDMQYGNESSGPFLLQNLTYRQIKNRDKQSERVAERQIEIQTN